MSGIDLKQVRRDVGIQQVLGLLNFVSTSREGSRLRGPCPIHGDSTPQSRVFSVHLGCHRYRCFRCHSAGTQLDLWAAVHGLSIYAAAKDLCEHLGISIPYLPSAGLSHQCRR